MLRAALALTIIAFALTGCGDAEVPDVARDAEGRPTEAGLVRADRLRVGDCFDDQDDRTPEDFPVVPCAEPHDNEAFFRFNVRGDRYPGVDALSEQASTRCRGQAFTDYVGEPIRASTLDVFYVVPSEETWDRYDDRSVICMLYEQSREPLTGSVRG